ncbi:MAG: hypothetical protein E6J90_05990 [Deltaproteobacteria bacterium]|nr:MAG: hypothetical protein E6J90_05990 [Deltaproteobacteria bacterium]
MAEVGDRLAARGEPRGVVGVLAEVGAQPAERLPGRRHGDQLGGVERRGLADPADRSGDVGDAAQRQRDVAHPQAAGLGDLVGPLARRGDPAVALGLAAVAEQPEAAHGRRAAGGRAPPHPVVDVGRPAEVVESLGRDRHARRCIRPG